MDMRFNYSGMNVMTCLNMFGKLIYVVMLLCYSLCHRKKWMNLNPQLKCLINDLRAPMCALKDTTISCSTGLKIKHRTSTCI